MPLNATAGAASPSSAAHPLIGALANSRIAAISARAAGVCLFRACSRYDFAGFIGFFGGNHPCFFVAIPARSNGFELLFYGVGISGDCYQIFCRCHNFACVIFTSRFRRGDVNVSLTMDTIPDGWILSILTQYIYLTKSISKIEPWHAQCFNPNPSTPFVNPNTVYLFNKKHQQN
jgi:hypothetical protein